MTDATISVHGADPASAAPLLRYTLWPHRSMSRRGFRYMIVLSSVLMSIPLYGIIGTAAFWIVGAFVIVDLALLFGLIGLTYRSGRVREIVELWPDRLRVERIEPNGERRIWEANPHWVKISLHDTRKIPSYLVLSSSGREVELGAFLTPQERRSLAADLRQGIARGRASAG